MLTALLVISIVLPFWMTLQVHLTPVFHSNGTKQTLIVSSLSLVNLLTSAMSATQIVNFS